MIPVCVIIKGYLRNFFNKECYNFELENDATMINLFEKLYEEFGNESASFIWHPDRNKLEGPISVYVSGEYITNINHQLKTRDIIVLSRVKIRRNSWNRMALINM